MCMQTVVLILYYRIAAEKEREENFIKIIKKQKKKIF